MPRQSGSWEKQRFTDQHEFSAANTLVPTHPGQAVAPAPLTPPDALAQVLLSLPHEEPPESRDGAAPTPHVGTVPSKSRCFIHARKHEKNPIKKQTNEMRSLEW